MKTWQWKIVFVLLCTAGINRIAFAAPLDIQLSSIAQTMFVAWSGEVQVSSFDDRHYVKPSIVSTPDGKIYVAYEDRSSKGIVLSRSTNGGHNWTIVTELLPASGSGITYNNPSITYLETSTEKWLCIVYAADYGPFRIFGMFLNLVSGIAGIAIQNHFGPPVDFDVPCRHDGLFQFSTLRFR